MANKRVSQRSTSWTRIVKHPGFRAGFSAVREGRGWEATAAKHAPEWWWWYELGRLFAASHYSWRWTYMPAEKKPVTPALIRALTAASRGAVFPRTDLETTIVDRTGKTI